MCIKFQFFWMLSFAIISTAFAGEEKKVDLNQVPQQIIAAIEEKLPDSSLVSANTETEPDGGFVYEVQGILKDGRKFEFDAHENGEIQEIEIEFAEDMVPKAVMKAIEQKLPGFEPTYIEASHSASLKVVRYEFVGKFGDETIDIDVSADGRRIEIADS
ncbi:MAG: PepSY domain-containing protein [Candidatus Competibacteraceae bacterium]|nr:PepSY domain-containing protein [Candidatus Competibacteraceae bacterium]